MANEVWKRRTFELSKNSLRVSFSNNPVLRRAHQDEVGLPGHVMALLDLRLRARLLTDQNELVHRLSVQFDHHDEVHQGVEAGRIEHRHRLPDAFRIAQALQLLQHGRNQRAVILGKPVDFATAFSLNIAQNPRISPVKIHVRECFSRYNRVAVIIFIAMTAVIEKFDAGARGTSAAMTECKALEFAPDFDRAVSHFHARDEYEVSPLRTLVGSDGTSFLAKDETGRMGLGAFKALGAPYAVARILDEAWRRQGGDALTPARFHDPEVRAFAASFTFVCASAGNHGIGVAAGARSVGAKARIHLADTVPQGFADRLTAMGAEVARSGAAYDDSVAAAIEDAGRTGATLLADGTWPGYTEIPKWVMEGYCVIAEELREAFEASGRWPSHVFLQGGVGGLAAAMAHMIRLNWAEQPELIVVEPEAAPCLQASHDAGRPTRADGPSSTMGRLDCKEPSIVAWRALERCGVTYDTLSDEEAEAAARSLAALGVETTPSGAAGYGALRRRVAGSLDPKAIWPLVIVSEGPA
jgi:diaminopropionate ammonia-lyase